MEALAGAVPGKLVAPLLEAGSEMVGELLAHRAVAAVGRDHEIHLPCKRLHVLDATPILDVHPDPRAGALQGSEHVDACGARKVVAVDLHMGAAVHHLHVVALFVMGGEFGEELGVGLLEEGQADVREHDSPAVGGDFRVLLVDMNLVRGIVLLCEQREVHAGRPAPMTAIFMVLVSYLDVRSR